MVAFGRTCEACRETRPAHVRQLWRCAYEAPVDHGQAWNGLGYDGPDPQTCPGYTTRLPETIELARAWRWWDKGQLDRFIGQGGELTDGARIGIELFEGQVRALESFIIKEQRDET